MGIGLEILTSSLLSSVEELTVTLVWPEEVSFAELVSTGMVVWVGVGFREEAVCVSISAV